MKLTGSMCAIVTPFRNGAIDAGALERLIEYQIQNGTSAIVPCGTTGESATLSHDEHHEVIALTIKFVRKRVPVIAGTGSNSTSEAISLTKFAKEWGADAALLITPYYNRPTQEGLYAHYMSVAEAVDLPLVLYNVPSRTAVNLAPETVARLAQHPNIVAIKEASGSTDYVSQLRLLCDITILSGNDNMTLPLMALGAEGVISVLANVAPRHCAELVEAAAQGDWTRARELHYQTFPLVEALFAETNPIPVKAALAMMGMISPEIRLPLTHISEKAAPRLRAELQRLGLLEGAAS
ncbi:MAG: 4-hydroxy-tetrahydrodipicolinate synthase [Candidatus Hydrogenedentota bacterium]|uniref:4-hydroxy-tetrahydrodipicolinate synthase n=1 Tax=Sumerlaea chitinivorans TaxID=2250252 RepID=A0A2Z4Y2R0_SUMC1|nr:4-hydroxy-tetrahydrodipicolinate synthase [Candidatus Sumerlaea chitinivorans]MCX7963292.1 4-hydroxy-tetrahydrodipicolinate synthase [Candidatus Sumerlaea chitinivorans]RMH29730.1 MAG: 4-hydroxy-tetrahydrodipicolinate synthase [Candidatus Hydrogenedentota bacterium]GIX44772.1 MAG: 4-hydroxy-tetrahydrodipicolinate synthase [Candidatus Sumerlaea sp.]